MYDLYLWTGCQSLPPLRDLSESIPVLADPTFPPRITLEQAIQIARPFLEDLAAWQHAPLPATFDGADLASLSPMCWVVSAYEPREGC